jgi:uncharacterized membrane protein YqjE
VIAMMRLLIRLLASGPSLMTSCRSLLRVQLEILKLEFANEKLRLIDGMWMLLTGWMLMTFGLIALTTLVLLLSWEAYKIQVLGILSFLFLAVGLAMRQAARKKMTGISS